LRIALIVLGPARRAMSFHLGQGVLARLAELRPVIDHALAPRATILRWVGTEVRDIAAADLAVMRALGLHLRARSPALVILSQGGACYGERQQG
jgi:hypothetical protein